MALNPLFPAGINLLALTHSFPFFPPVIDFCLVKQMVCDWSTKYCCLQTVWASQASLTQRKGRAGRVSSGRCYRLITKEFLNNHIPEYSVPEMRVREGWVGVARSGGRGMLGGAVFPSIRVIAVLFVCSAVPLRALC